MHVFFVCMHMRAGIIMYLCVCVCARTRVCVCVCVRVCRGCAGTGGIAAGPAVRRAIERGEGARRACDAAGRAVQLGTCFACAGAGVYAILVRVQGAGFRFQGLRFRV